jgi:hypothetical protein
MQVTDKSNRVGNDHLSSRRGLLSVSTPPLSPRAVLHRAGSSSAELTLTWDGRDWDTVDAVAVDGVLEECSVDNSAGSNIATSSCFKPCTNSMGVGWAGRVCMHMKLPLGSVYDLLVTRHTDRAHARALRVQAPWVHNAGRCLLSEGTATVCGGPDITWHGGLLSMGDRAQMGTKGAPITPTNGTIGPGGVSFSVPKARSSNDMTDLVYLTLDRGMRITRIVTVTSSSDDAITRLKNAKTREDVMIICEREYDDVCILTEHMQIPTSTGSSHSGWSFEQQYGSSVRASSGVPGSVLWVADIPQDNCHIEVGSWLLASIPLNTDTSISALFSSSVSQMCDSPQAVVLVRPGFAWPKLVRSNHHIEWSITFIELQELDELGVSWKRR